MSAIMNRLGTEVVHEICTNQVVVTLQACVKELVENSLDAGASKVEIRLRESGAELLEVVDDGRGISPDDYDKVAVRHATSKIRKYQDLSSDAFSTFGFRGEALSAICAMGDMTIATKTANESAASLLSYDRFGRLVSRNALARETGTTVSVRELFKRLPVRHREFQKNAKAQVGATLRLIQAYAVAEPQVRFSVVSEKLRGPGSGRTTLMSTSGAARNWTQAAAAVLGDAALSGVLTIAATMEGWEVEGLISPPFGGRRSRDAQLFFVNRRPVDPPKRIAKLINDTYHQYNSRAWPLVILAFTAPQGMVDVNVTPDKKTVFLHREEALLGELQKSLTQVLSAGPDTSQRGLCSFGVVPVLKDTSIALKAEEAKESPRSTLDPLPEPSVHASSLEETRGKPDLVALPLQDFTVPQTLTAEVDVEGLRIIEFREEAPSHAQAEEAAQPPHASTTADQNSRRSVWSKSLKRRHSETSEELPGVEVIELQEEAEMSEEQALPSVEPALMPLPPIPMEGVDDLGLDMQVQEYVLEDTSRQKPEAPVDSALVKQEDGVHGSGDADQSTRNPALQASKAVGCSFTSPIQLEGLRRCAARRRARAEASPDLDSDATATTSSKQFPRAFSLAELGSHGSGEGVSVEEVASCGVSNLRFDKTCFSKMRVIGQFNLGFIIAALPQKQDDGQSHPPGDLQLFIVDQHASDEKFRFEALNRETRLDRQPLVTPHPLQLTPAQEQLAEAHAEVFRMNGFELKKDEAQPPGRRLRATALPSCQGLVFNDKDIHDLLYKLEEAEVSENVTQSDKTGLLDLSGHRALWSATAAPRPQKVWMLLASRACRYATMIGKALRIPEMERILRNLGTLQQPWNCPHGRPTMRHLVDTNSAKKAPVRPRRPLFAGLPEAVDLAIQS
ncbi:PMS1 [Symbiodinium sp. KB8]|nr:PMS1 [Symbiodinium sp. KB8]